MMENETTVCRFCKSANVRRYAYGRIGFHSEEEQKKFLEKNILAGCEITPDSPLCHCDDCQKDFGRLGDN